VDKTIEIVVVAMVALIVATIMLFLVQDRTENFSGFLDNQQSNAQCELWKTQYKNSGCNNPDLESSIEDEDNGCGELPTCG